MLIKKILGSLRNADNAYDLIQDKDKIAVGISGGKDSVLLLYCLSLYKRFSKKDFEVIGVSIDVGFENDLKPIVDFFLKDNIQIVIEKTRIKEILELHKHHDNLDCSLCANLKKGALVKVSKELGCNKLALGHNVDDAIETLLLNQIYGGKISTFQPKQILSRDNITMIRPLVYASENDIRKTCTQLSLPIVASNCPRDGYSKRQDIKELLEKIYEQYPPAKKNFQKMLLNDQQISLWKEKDKQ